MMKMKNRKNNIRSQRVRNKGYEINKEKDPMEHSLKEGTESQIIKNEQIQING